MSCKVQALLHDMVKLERDLVMLEDTIIYGLIDYLLLKVIAGKKICMSGLTLSGGVTLYMFIY